MSREQFLVTWRSRARRGRGRATLQQSSPRSFVTVRILLGLLALGVFAAALIEVPQHVSGLAEVVPRPSGVQAGDDVLLVVFVPAASLPKLRVGQTVSLQSDVTGERLQRAITGVEREILNPESVRKRLGLDVAASVQSSAVAVARFEPPPADVPALAYAGRLYRAEVAVEPRRLIALLPPISNMLALMSARDGMAILKSPAIDGDIIASATQVPGGTQSVPITGPAGNSSDLRAEYYGLVSEEILHTLQGYEQMPVEVPRLDPHVDSDASNGAHTRMYVRVPYQMNTKKNEAIQMTNISNASGSLQGLFGRFPNEVRQGKGSPAVIQALLQDAVNNGDIRGLEGDWPPERTDVERWMSYFGIGVDCSAFVYEALLRVDRTLSAKGKPGLVRSLDGPVNSMDSNDLAIAGEPLASPDELSPGDLMNLDEEEYDGHIRIVATVHREGRALIFTTAEAAEGSINGPAARQWRFPDSSRFADLEQYEKGEWHRASLSDQTYRYWRRLPLIGAR